MMISLVLSTFNGEKYIIEQLDSIKNQTRVLDEVLIFDDKSSDNTPKIIKSFIIKNNLSNWKLHINEKNIGWRENFMRGIWKTKGDYIFTCDQDDIWNLNKINFMIEEMKKNPNILLLTSKYTEFYEDGKSICKPEKITEGLIKQQLRYNFTAIPYPGCTYCLNQRLIKISEKYWQSDFPHDSLFWRLAMFSDGLYTINQSLIKMRKHKDSTFTKESALCKSKIKKREALDYAERVYLGMEQFIRDEQIDDKDIKLHLIDECLKWNYIRKKFYDEKKVLTGIRLVKYIKFYPKFRTYLGDWIWVYRRGEFTE